MRFQRFRSPDGQVSWRFLARNHRIVARSPHGYPDADQAAAAIALVRAQALTAALDFSSDRGGRWQWTLRLDAVPLAVSAHPYGRRREADSAAQRFREGVAHAAVDIWVAERGELRPRAPRLPDLGARDLGTRPAHPAPASDFKPPRPRRAAEDTSCYPARFPIPHPHDR